MFEARVYPLQLQKISFDQQSFFLGCAASVLSAGLMWPFNALPRFPVAEASMVDPPLVSPIFVMRAGGQFNDLPGSSKFCIFLFGIVT